MTGTSLLELYSPARAVIYEALTSSPNTQWNVKGLTEVLPSKAQPSRDVVRANLYLLLAEQVGSGAWLPGTIAGF